MMILIDSSYIYPTEGNQPENPEGTSTRTTSGTYTITELITPETTMYTTKATYLTTRVQSTISASTTESPHTSDLSTESTHHQSDSSTIALKHTTPQTTDSTFSSQHSTSINEVLTTVPSITFGELMSLERPEK